MGFIEQLCSRWLASNSLVCVGLDPDPSKFPLLFDGRDDAIFEFCRDIVDATAEFACAFKPQIAYFAAHAAEDALTRLIAHIHTAHAGIPVILDAKRGDIGSTASMYAIEAFERFAADAVTLNPYMGRDSAQPFLDHAGKGCVFLCHTSNPGARDFQERNVSDGSGAGAPLYQRVAEAISQHWNDHGNCALVLGATFPEELKLIRGIVGDMPLLIPGIGAQGGDIEATVRNGKTANGTGLMINSSRGILYASQDSNFASAAASAAERLRDEINRYR